MCDGVFEARSCKRGIDLSLRLSVGSIPYAIGNNSTGVDFKLSLFTCILYICSGLRRLFLYERCAPGWDVVLSCGRAEREREGRRAENMVVSSPSVTTSAVEPKSKQFWLLGAGTGA